jgi:hypothetical protein
MGAELDWLFQRLFQILSLILATTKKAGHKRKGTNTKGKKDAKDEPKRDEKDDDDDEEEEDETSLANDNDKDTALTSKKQPTSAQTETVRLAGEVPAFSEAIGLFLRFQSSIVSAQVCDSLQTLWNSKIRSSSKGTLHTAFDIILSCLIEAAHTQMAIEVRNRYARIETNSDYLFPNTDSKGFLRHFLGV